MREFRQWQEAKLLQESICSGISLIHLSNGNYVAFAEDAVRISNILARDHDYFYDPYTEDKYEEITVDKNELDILHMVIGVVHIMEFTNE